MNINNINTFADLEEYVENNGRLVNLKTPCEVAFNDGEKIKVKISAIAVLAEYVGGCEYAPQLVGFVIRKGNKIEWWDLRDYEPLCESNLLEAIKGGL